MGLYIAIFLATGILTTLLGRATVWKIRGDKDMNWWQASLLFLFVLSASLGASFLVSLTKFG